MCRIVDFSVLIDRCIAIMQERNITNKELAQLAQISEATVSRVLATKGAVSSTATLAAICDALGVEEIARYEVVDPPRSKDEIYEARIEDFKQRAEKEAREKRIIFIAFCVAVAFIFTLFAVDLLNPSVGWFRG